jgi:hypothetical protein
LFVDLVITIGPILKKTAWYDFVVFNYLRKKNMAKITIPAWLRAAVRHGVSVAVGAVVSWFIAKSATIHAAWLAAMIPAASIIYYNVVSSLEKKFPKLGWLLGLLPQPPVVAPPTPAPTPPAAGKKK